MNKRRFHSEDFEDSTIRTRSGNVISSNDFKDLLKAVLRDNIQSAVEEEVKKYFDNMWRFDRNL